MTRSGNIPTYLVQGLGGFGWGEVVLLHLRPLDLEIDACERTGLFKISKGLLSVTEAGSELVVQLADGVPEEHALFEMLASGVDASPKGDVADVVEGFLDLVEEGLVVTE